MTVNHSHPLSAERLEGAFLALVECAVQRRQLTDGTCIQFLLEADEDSLETCLAYFVQQGVKLEFLGTCADGLRKMQLTARQ